YPHAASDHQRVNARVMAEAGAAVVIEDAQLTAPRLASEVTALLADRSRLAATASSARAAAPADAARRVAGELRPAAAARGPAARRLDGLTALRRTIAVAGTHGKTTTAAMLVHALRGAGADPGWLIGGTPDAQLPNAAWRPGEWLVVGADESDRSMLELHVEVA